MNATTKLKITGDYNLSYLNTDHTIESVVEGFTNQPEGRVCLYGPPGTGKTEFVRYLANRLNKQLVIKSGSDLLSMWVGGTEKNISNMFKEARKEEALLFLDEADSFLQDRQQANRSWEITQVNELLVQMEEFNGLFICATNFMDMLDTASLRRFDLKIKFGFMNIDQRWGYFQSIAKTLKIDQSLIGDEKKLKQGIAKLDNLTPGDFALIKRKARFMGSKINGVNLLDALEKESTSKPGANKNVIGFAA